jgi:thioredoxin reductase (NADPH)
MTASSSRPAVPADAAVAAADVIETDALVIGAGPVGLFQVFQLGLLEMKAQLVDSLPFIGGQCVELYADKPIYDIPGIPVCTGRELVERLQQQIAPFKAGVHLGQEVTVVQPVAGSDGAQGIHVETSAGTRFNARVVIIAAGAGAFQPRPLKLAGIDAHVGRGLLYHRPEAATLAGLRVVIVGDGDAALEAAIRLATAATADRPAEVTLLHRRDEFRAEPATVARMHALCASGAMRFVAALPVGFAHDAGVLHTLNVMPADGSIQPLALDRLLVLQGLSPRLGPIAHWGLQLERRQLVVDTTRFETSAPGIFGVGDIVTYPGKKKLIVCGFHEATLAAWAAAERVFPDRAIPLQYTTTSPRLHELLGVSPGGSPA